MKPFSYSVAIRTLGTAGEKYEKLLNSIRKQTVQPEKTVVVLPEGCALPHYRLGIEEFVYSRKGMMPQRLESLKYIDSQYTLFCDDDVEFSEDFTLKLVEPLESFGYSVSAGPLLDFFPPDSLKYTLASLLGGACVMVRGRGNTYVRLLRTGGWSYNHSIDTQSHKVYYTESLPGTCYMAATTAMKAVHLEQEYWAERTGYSAFEDRIMIGKLIVNGYKACVVSDAKYTHNDGRTSVANLKTEPIYAGAFNHYVFWHRFLYSLSNNPREKLWMKVCINYYIWMGRLYSRLLLLSGRRTKEQAEASRKGVADAKQFVKSEEYRDLPKVICK